MLFETSLACWSVLIDLYDLDTTIVFQLERLDAFGAHIGNTATEIGSAGGAFKFDRHRSSRQVTNRRSWLLRDQWRRCHRQKKN
ncbi:MAG: hypothetical protein DMG61_23735 [Acidobacteria bacterium]|nr:MAG: hypothetical protein DMG61_23735 [Acidobacteriota bacterium]